MLTKIVTKNKRQISFNYTQEDTSDDYPSYSERWDSVIQNGSTYQNSPCDYGATYYGFAGFGWSGSLAKTFSYSTENRLFLTSIQFPNGAIDFSTSSRNDMLGSQKLDSIEIFSSGSEINCYRFNYNYFDASGVSGNGYHPSDSSEFTTAINLRLKLLSLSDNSGSTYSFFYNATPLPPKNSFAQDYWGFYNGQLSNHSLIPNPSRIGKSTLGNNGNNHSSSPFYSQASILDKIQYPTGGVDSFEYELNQFANYSFPIPDSSGSIDSISSGNGLRIHAIDYYDLNKSLVKKTNYTYNGGISVDPLLVYKNYQLTGLYQSGVSVTTYSYIINELSDGGFYSSDFLGSINCIGYSSVTKKDVDSNEIPNGSVETDYYNSQDNISNSGIYVCQIGVALPATKNPNNPLNGSVKSIIIRDKNNNILKRIDNNYSNVVSPYYYGARFFDYGNILNSECPGYGSAYWDNFPENLIAFYPIYDFETLLTNSKETDYFGTDSIVINTANSYDQYDQISSVEKTSSTGTNDIDYYYPYDYPGTYPYASSIPVLDSMVSRNRLSDVVSLKTWKNIPNHQIATYEYDKSYELLSDKILKNKVKIYDPPHPYAANPEEITYDAYDSTNGNLLQYTQKGVTNSLIWDYQGEYVVAEIINAIQSDVAYTSFEADGKGNWSFSGTPTAGTGITGNKYYSLSTGNITKSSLSSSQKYIISYWLKSGSVSISGGTQSNSLTGRTSNGWTYHEVTITGTTSLTLSGSGVIDELRLYPTNAQMTSYTYDPLIGETSKCGIDSRIEYYDYDNVGRLQDEKDLDGNIIKTYQYHYQH